MTPDPVRTQAAALADLWYRLATRHLAVGCSCMGSGISVTLEDFERDIADYLLGESERLDVADVAAFIVARGPLRGQRQPVRILLARLQSGEATPAVAGWLLERLERTLQSCARLHGLSVPEAAVTGTPAARSSLNR